MLVVQTAHVHDMKMERGPRSRASRRSDLPSTLFDDYLPFLTLLIPACLIPFVPRQGSQRWHQRGRIVCLSFAPARSLSAIALQSICWTISAL